MRRWMLAWLLASSAATAFAQLGEVSISAGVSRLRNNLLGTATTQQGQTIRFTADTDFRLGFRLTINSYEHFGHEIGYAYSHGKLNPQEFGGGMSMHQGIYNFLAYATAEGKVVRPFVTGGVHFSTFYPPGASVFQGNGVTKFGYNYGGGVKMQVRDPFMVRLDVRNYTTGKPLGDFFRDQSGLLHQLEVSAGFAFMF